MIYQIANVYNTSPVILKHILFKVLIRSLPAVKGFKHCAHAKNTEINVLQGLQKMSWRIYSTQLFTRLFNENYHRMSTSRRRDNDPYMQNL